MHVVTDLAFVATMTAVLTPVASAATAQPSSLLVLDTQALSVESPVAATLTGIISQRIAAQAQHRVISAGDLRSLLSLEESKTLMGCEENYACLAAISKAAHAQLIVASSVGRIGKSMVLNLVLIDAEKANPLQRVSKAFSSEAAMAAETAQAVASLFGWDGDAAPRAKFKLDRNKGLSFAVLDLSPSGVAKEVAANLTQVLSAEIKRVEGAKVISRDDLVAMLQFEEEKQLFGCVDDTSCIAELGGALGVDKLVVGNVGKMAQSYIISLRLIDAKQVKVDNLVSESFKGEEEQLLQAIRHAGRSLLGITVDSPGNLVVAANEQKAQVFLDDKSLGALPLPPIKGLAIGRHSLRLAKPGFYDWQSDVYINPDDTTAVWTALAERPAKWYQKWWVWTLAGAVVLGAGATTIYFVLNKEQALGTGAVSLDGF